MTNQTSSKNQSASTVGIIGGGKIGLQLLNLFTQSNLTQVLYLVDRDINAPAVAAAQSAHIPTFTDLEQALASAQVDFIFEVTGSEYVAEILKKDLAGKSTKLITHDMARVILVVIEENRQNVNSQVTGSILEIKKNISHSLEDVSGAVDGIKQTTSDMRYLALNARIEAARAGEHGRGFGIVAQQMEQLAQTVRDLAQEVERVNTDLKSTAGQIDEALEKLK